MRAAALGFPSSEAGSASSGQAASSASILASLAVIPVAIWAGISLDIHISSRSLGRAAVVLVVLIFGALAEEMMFRGYPFQRLERPSARSGRSPSSRCSSHSVHLSNPGASPLGLLNTVLIGLVLAHRVPAYPRTVAVLGDSLWLERRLGAALWPARQRIAPVQRCRSRNRHRSALADRRQLRGRGQRSRRLRRRSGVTGRLEVAAGAIGQTVDIFATRRRTPRQRSRHPKLMFAGSPARGLIIGGNGESWLRCRSTVVGFAALLLIVPVCARPLAASDTKSKPKRRALRLRSSILTHPRSAPARGWRSFAACSQSVCIRASCSPRASKVWRSRMA